MISNKLHVRNPTIGQPYKFSLPFQIFHNIKLHTEQRLDRGIYVSKIYSILH